MSGGSNTRQNADQYSDQVTTTTPTGISGYERQFGNDYSNLLNMFNQRTSQPLTLERAPIFSNSLDPVVQNTLSKGIQDIKAKQSAEQRGTAGALSVAGTGDNSALLNALNRQSQISQAGSINQLYPSALEAQRNFDLQRQAMIQARNQEAMNARGQLTNELSGGMNLLQALQQMAATARGTSSRTTGNVVTNSGTNTSRSYF